MSIAYRNPLAKPIHVETWRRPSGNRDFHVVRGFGVPDPPRAPHNGIDLGDGLCGDLVLAGAAGRIDYASADPNSGGALIVIINHSAERTWYAHLSWIGVRVGQQVSAGQQLGKVGATGWAEGCHLHYQRQVWDTRTKSWVNVDPASILDFVEKPLPDTGTGGNVEIISVYDPPAVVRFAAGDYTAYHMDGTTKPFHIGAGGSWAHGNAKVNFDAGIIRVGYHGLFVSMIDGIFATGGPWWVPAAKAESITPQAAVVDDTRIARARTAVEGAAQAIASAEEVLADG